MSRGAGAATMGLPAWGHEAAVTPLTRTTADSMHAHSSPAPDTPPATAKQWLRQQALLAGNARHRLRWLACLDAVFAVLQAALLAWLAATVVTGDGAILQPALTLAALLLVRVAAGSARSLASATVAARVTRGVRSEVAEALLYRPARDDAPGTLSTLLLEHTRAVGAYHGGYAVQQSVGSVATILFLVVAFSVDWVVGLVFLITAPLIPLFMILVGTGAQRAADQQLRSLEFLGGYFIDRVRGALTLRVFGREKAEVESVHKASGAFRDHTMKVLRIAFLSSAVLELFSALAVALVAVYVGLHLLDLVAFGPGPSLTFGTGMFLLALAPEFYQPLRQLAAGYHERAAGIAAADALAPRLQQHATDAPSQALSAAPALTLEQLAFTPSGAAKPLFEQLSLQLSAGECLVLRGDSGAGKTTLLRLLAGLLPADRGDIRWDDLPASAALLDQGSLGWAGQHPWVVPGSLADNLRLAAPDADDASLHSVLAAVALDQLPLGLSTPVSEFGGGLSGGQLRRLALARALLSPAPVLLLDEPTAELDPQLEQQIVAHLAQLKGQRTLVIATHSELCGSIADRTLWLPLSEEDAHHV